MRLVVQRVSSASVSVQSEIVGLAGPGLVVLAGFKAADTPALALKLARKVVDLRIFEGAGGKIDRSVYDLAGTVLAISQFTLYADTRRGRRPSFDAAADPEFALPLYEAFCEASSGRIWNSPWSTTAP